MTEHDASATMADAVAPVSDGEREATAPAPEHGAIHDDLLDGIAGGGGAWTRLFGGR